MQNPEGSAIEAPLTTEPAGDALPRRLGVAALILIVVAFNAPIATMAGFAQLSVGFGNGIGAPLAFFAAGAVLLVFSVGFVGMSRFIDHPGAFYRFIVAGIGRSPGLAGAFLATLAYLFLCAGAYPYMGLIAVDLMKRLTGGQVLPWGAWSVIFLGVCTVLGLLRIDLSMKLLGVLVCLEIAVVAIYEVAVAIQGGPEGYSPESFAPAAFGHGSAGLGVLFAMLCMIGIESAACFRAETKDPEQAVGRATYIAIVFMAIFYGLGVWFYIITQGASRAVASASTDPVGSFFTSVNDYLGVFFVNLVAAILVTSQVAAINAIQGAASRYLYALGRDGVLPKGLSRVHSKLESPFVAVLTVSGFSLLVLAVIYVFKMDAVAAYAAISGMGIYFLLPLLIATSLAVIVFYRKNSDIDASWWTRLGAPAIAFVALLVLLVLSSLNLKVLVGTQTVAYFAIAAMIAVAAAGWLLAARLKKTRPEVYATIGNQ